MCSNGKAARALTDIGAPAIDWVALAQVSLAALVGGWRSHWLALYQTCLCPGCRILSVDPPHLVLLPCCLWRTPTCAMQGMGVTASRATTCEELATALAAALERQGPSLIEAVL